MHSYKWLVPVLLASLAGCAGIVGEKRHTPAEIAAYRPQDFVAPIASEVGERAAAGARTEKIRLAFAEPAATATGDEESGAPGALWAIAFLNVDRAQGLTILQNALIDIENKPVDFQRAVLSAAYTMYSNEAAETLVAMEYWSKSDGRLMHSDQLTLAKAFTAGGIDQGYLVVVELDDRATPVNLADVIAAEVRVLQPQ